MPATIYSLAPIKVTIGAATTVLAAENHAFTQEIIANAHSHTGNIAPTLIAVPGANPRVVLSIPFKLAFDTFGLGVSKCTLFEVYLSKYIDAERGAGSTHPKLELETDCVAVAQITGWSVNVDGILMATVEFVLLAKSQTNPLKLTASQALPALAAQPVLHTLGPISINGSVIPGLTSHSSVINGAMIAQRSDGDKFPRVAARPHIAPSMELNHADPIAVFTALGFLGADITANVVAYFKLYDIATGVTVDDSGAISITVAKGRIHPRGIESNQGAVSTSGMTVMGISADGATHPFVIATNANPPEPA